jgi:hypothetical protein
MRGGILFLGILLLLVGAALYFLVPGVDANVRYARDVNTGINLAALPFIGLIAMALGAILTLVGLIAPSPVYRVYEDRDRDYIPVERSKTIERDSRGRVKRVHTREVRRDE